MKIAIHHRESSFSDRWIKFCRENNIAYKIVNCYSNAIIKSIIDCDVLVWHYHHAEYKDDLFAKQLLFSIEQSGKKTFPDFSTGWHFDDKVGQKYLLEAINAPLVPSFVYYDSSSAKNWINETTFPKVFKLRGGAGAANVQLIRNKNQANKIVKKAFGKGFSQFDKVGHFLDFWQKYKDGKVGLNKLFKSLGRLLVTTEYAKMKGYEKGYVYFQNYIPNNDSDVRIIVIGSRSFGIKRMVRKGDFRASGSGDLEFLDDETMDKRCLEIAFSTSRRLNAQCLAYDFVYDENNNPLIIEISYGFAMTAYDPCSGYWNENLDYQKGNFVPQNWILEDIINGFE